MSNTNPNSKPIPKQNPKRVYNPNTPIRRDQPNDPNIQQR